MKNDAEAKVFTGKVVFFDHFQVHVILFQSCEHCSDSDHPNLFGLPFVQLNHNLVEVLTFELTK